MVTDEGAECHLAQPGKQGQANRQDDLIKLACLWSQLELCGPRPAKVSPFERACCDSNIDSFLLFTRLKRLPKVPTFAEAVIQQKRVFSDVALKNDGNAGREGCVPGALCYLDQPNEQGLASGQSDHQVDPALNADPSLASNGSKQYCLFDDDEGEAWEQESDDWWLTDVERQQVHECSTVPTIEATLFEGESVQAALNARLRRTARLTFFDDESGEDEPQIEPDDYEQLAGIVDKRGMPEFSKAAKFTGPWLGMVFKRGSCGMGYYRDGFKMNLCLTTLLPAVADVSPVTLKLSELIGDNSKDKEEDEDR